MSKDRLPWFRFFPDDWLLSKSVRLMSRFERSLYVDLLAYQWRDGSIPTDPEDLAILLGVSADEMIGAWRRLGKMFEPHPEDSALLINKRLDDERNESNAKRDQNRENVRKRWDKAKEAKEGPVAPEVATPNLFVIEGGNETDTTVSPSKNEGTTNIQSQSQSQSQSTDTDVSGDEAPKVDTPYSQIERVIVAVHSRLNYDEVAPADVRRHLKPDSPIRGLLSRYGEAKTVEMFIHAATTWQAPPTWYAVFDRRNAILADMTGNTGKTRKGRESAAEKLERLNRELDEKEGVVDDAA